MRFWGSALLWSVVTLGIVLGENVFSPTLTFAGTKIFVDRSCEGLLFDDVQDAQDNKGADALHRAALSEIHDIWSLVDSDPEKNLAFQHPSMAMNAAQIALNTVRTMGVEDKPHPHKPDSMVRSYAVFDKGGPETDYRSIVGHEDAKKTFVDSLYQMARGDASGRVLVLFEGPSGTGKSEYAETIAAAVKWFELRDPNKFEYVPVVRNLREIPALRGYIEEDDEGNEKDLALPYRESPLVLLPAELQKKVVQMAAPRIRDLTGTEPTDSVFTPSPQLQQFLDAILGHHSKEIAKKHKRPMTTKEVLQVLNHHFYLKRDVSKEGAVIIDGKEGDVNWRALAVGENPIYIGDPDPNNPFRFTYNGSYLKANRRILFLDEILRADKKLLSASLGLIEGRRITFGIGPSVPLDLVLYAASNGESIAKLEQAGGLKALFSRVTPISMKWSIYPHEILETMLLMSRNSLYVRELSSLRDSQEVGSEDAIVKIEEVKKLFPAGRWDEPLQGPDRRYALYFGTGEDRVAVSPHALMLMAYITAASRISTDVNMARQVLPNASMVNTPLFQDPITRMKFLTHRYEDLTAAQWDEMSSLSTLMGEGNFGIDMRHVARNWLPLAISMAREHGNENTLTPLIVKEAFKKFLQKPGHSPDNATRLYWLRLMDALTINLTVPEIQRDINRAFAAREGKQAYKAIMNEITNKKATNEKSELLKEVEKIYPEVNNRQSFSPEKIGMFYTRHMMEGESRGDDVYHPGLMEAINEYYARAQAKLIPFHELDEKMSQGSGDPKEKEHMDNFNRIMKYDLGYSSPRAILEARALVSEAEQMRKKLRGEQ